MGEASVLAIVETVLAITLSILLAVKRGSAIYIAAAACIAPFLLLRTERSTELALQWADKLFGLLHNFMRIKKVKEAVAARQTVLDTSLELTYARWS